MIFITENDVMGANLPVYHADRIVEDIAEITGFTVEEIEGLTENNAAVAN